MQTPVLLMISLFAVCPVALAGQAPRLFDGHIHYSSDVWDKLAPERVLTLLSEAGITHALVSATPGEGAERLYHAAPDRIVPFLRPYARPEHRFTWFREASMLDYVHEQLARIPYRGIGEFHLHGSEASSPVVVEIVKLARKRGLALHAHTDEEGIQALLEQAIDIPVIWAHGGFDVAEARLHELLTRHRHLYIELSFREGITAEGKLSPAWYKLMTEHPKRFLVGTDTYTPQRWVMLPELTNQTRQWLQQLPEDVARDIAFANAMRLFPRQ